MNLQRIFISKVLPIQNTFKLCNIYSFEIKKIEQKVAESINAKNIHAALDIPDFRHIKDSRISRHIIELSIDKLKIFDNYIIENNSQDLILIKNNIKYQIIQFTVGVVPSIDIKESNLLFFMYQPGFKRIFYCGSFNIKDKLTKKTLNKFYEENCEKGTKYFTNFNCLK
jgi:hypothetical protein